MTEHSQNLYVMINAERFNRATEGFDLAAVGRAMRALSTDLQSGQVPEGPPPKLRGKARKVYENLLDALGDVGQGRITP